MTTTAIHNQSAEDYHASPACSASRLKQLQRSPAHMKHTLDHPQPPTPAMIIGSATHSAILEPVLFVKEWARLPEGDGRSKAVREAKAELGVQFGVDHVLKADVYDTILAMRDSVFDNALALDLLDGADTEVSHYWTEGGEGSGLYQMGWGVECKARIDAIPPTDTLWGDCLVDIKTTVDASEFQRSVYNFGLHLQAAHYLSAANRTRFVFICVEKAPPHCVAIYELDDDALTLARSELDRLLGLWAECEGENEWPSYPVEIQELSLPGWAYTR
jgi:hypothetical protein